MATGNYSLGYLTGSGWAVQFAGSYNISISRTSKTTATVSCTFTLWAPGGASAMYVVPVTRVSDGTTTTHIVEQTETDGSVVGYGSWGVGTKYTKTTSKSITIPATAGSITVYTDLYAYATNQYSDGKWSDSNWISFTLSYGAQPSHTVTFNPNGNSNVSTSSSTKYDGDSKTLSLPNSTWNSYTKSGAKVTISANGGTFSGTHPSAVTDTYTFSNWNTVSNNSGTSYTKSQSYSTNSDLYLYAIYSKTAGTTTLPAKSTFSRGDTTANGYKVTFDGNGGTCTTPPLTAKDTTSYTLGAKLNSSADGSGTGYDFGGSITVSSSFTAYAIWSSSTAKGSITLPKASTCTKSDTTENGYTITFDGGGGTTPSAITQVNTRSYSLSKWNTKAAGTGTDYNPGASYKPSAATTLYTKWSSSVAKGTITLPSTTKTGFSFDGWYLNDDLIGTNGESWTPSANSELVARWTDITNAKITEFTITNPTANSLTINVTTDSNCNKWSYYIKKDNGAYGNEVVFSTTNTNSNSYEITDLSPASSYTIKVKVYKTSNSSLTTTSDEKTLSTLGFMTFSRTTPINLNSVDSYYTLTNSRITNGISFNAIVYSNTFYNRLTILKDDTTVVRDTLLGKLPVGNFYHESRFTTSEYNSILSLFDYTSQSSIKLKLTSYANPNYTEEIGNSIVTVPVTLDSTFNPSITSLDYTDSNSTTLGITKDGKKLIQNHSSLQFTSIRTRTIRQASIVQYSFKYGSQSATTQNISQDGYYTVGTVKSVGSIKLSLTIRDSRGLQATKEITASVLSYNPPVVTTFFYERPIVGQGLNASFKGYYPTYSGGASYDNRITAAQYRYQELNSGVWSDWINFLDDPQGGVPLTQSRGDFSYEGVVTKANLDSDKSYNISLRFRDALGTYTTITDISRKIEPIATIKNGDEEARIYGINIHLDSDSHVHGTLEVDNDSWFLDDIHVPSESTITFYDIDDNSSWAKLGSEVKDSYVDTTLKFSSDNGALSIKNANGDEVIRLGANGCIATANYGSEEPSGSAVNGTLYFKYV